MCVKMKFLVITVFIVLCKNQSVNSTYLNFMYSQFNNLAASFRTTLMSLKDQIKTLFTLPTFPVSTESPVKFIPKPPGEVEIKRTFEEFVETTTAENETEFPQYSMLKSEPTALMSTPQLALYHGRRVESHFITTVDGYILTMHRITSTLKVPQYYSNNTIILHHGLLGSSADWLLLGPGYSLAYLLSDAGYDVWMSNARGNYYSRGHIRKSINTTDYWQFSWQQMGEIDLAAVIDYIRLTKRFNNDDYDKIDYIGHSMGATALLVLLSTRPTYNKYLRIGVLLAPLAYMGNVDGPLKVLMSMSTNPPEQLLKLMGSTEFVPSRRLPNWVALKYCKGPILFCCNPLYFITGGMGAVASWNSSYIARILYHVPAGGSTNTLLHYAQLVLTGKFHRFYNDQQEYNLSKVTLPIALISSDVDWLAPIPDVLRLYFSIANPVDHYIIRGKNFSHPDFVFSPEAKDTVYTKVIDYLNNGLNWYAIKQNEILSDSKLL